MSVSNRFGRNIEASKSDLEAKIEMKLDVIKSYHVKTIYSLNMKISAIKSTKPLLYYEEPSSYLTKWPLLKSPDKYSHASQFSKYFTLKVTHSLNFNMVV